jgi:hypothetical protein
MASTASEIIATAKTEAEAARQSALSSLSGMSNNLQAGYDTQKQATTDYYTNMMNNLENAYNKDVKSAYANSMTNRQNLTNSLNRMGLTNSGYGVSQLLGVNSQYSKNLADLQNTLATNKANTGYQQQQAMADLYGDYVNNKNALEQYLYEAGQNAYDNTFDRRYQAEQDAIANALQQQYYNYLMYSSRSGGGSRSSGSSSNDVDLGSSDNTNTSQLPEGVYTSKADVAKAAGLSVAGNFDEYVKAGYIDSFTDEQGRTFYAVGDVKPTSSLPTKNTKTVVPTFNGIKRFGL